MSSISTGLTQNWAIRGCVTLASKDRPISNNLCRLLKMSLLYSTIWDKLPLTFFSKHQPPCLLFSDGIKSSSHSPLAAISTSFAWGSDPSIAICIRDSCDQCISHTSLHIDDVSKFLGQRWLLTTPGHGWDNLFHIFLIALKHRQLSSHSTSVHSQGQSWRHHNIL